MSSERGLLLTCDRCGAVKFCKYTGTDVFDGGYTRNDKFEKAEDWGFKPGIGDMCPKCTSAYEEAIASFMRNGRIAAQEKEA